MGCPPYQDVTVGNLLARLAADVPAQPALIYEGGPRYSFADLEREARTIARGLMASGVQPGERVALWATNVPEWVVLQFALAKITDLKDAFPRFALCEGTYPGFRKRFLIRRAVDCALLAIVCASFVGCLAYGMFAS